MAEEVRSIPFRTGKRKPLAAMVLCLKAWKSSTLPGLKSNVYSGFNHFFMTFDTFKGNFFVN